MAEISRGEIRALWKQAQVLAREAAALLLAQRAAEDQVDVAADALKDSLTLSQLQAMPLEKLKPLVDGRVAWTALQRAGCRTVADAYASSITRLRGIRGVGDQSASEVINAAAKVYEETHASVRLALNPDGADPATQGLIAALVRLDTTNQATRGLLPAAQSAAMDLIQPLERAQATKSGIRWLLTGKKRKQEARDAAEALTQILNSPGIAALRDSGSASARLSAVDRLDRVAAFRAEPARFLSLLDARVGNVQSIHGDLDQSVVDRIDAIELDTSLLKVMLRRYQSFGARFVLAQDRVILGDDMGLGKTIQALAVMCHLAAAKPQTLGAAPDDGLEHAMPPRFLVIAPASVLINWERELGAKSDLDVFVLHGTREPGNVAAWQQRGGVAVTTFEYTAHVHLHHDVDLLVVDEAHYVKNPTAQRTKRVEALVGQARRVMFMTGTPIENRATEFVDLITMVNEPLGKGLTRSAVVVNPVEFRRKVAPVYLRRNAAEVLSELPERIEIDEWEEMTPADLVAYETALASGNFMAIRRAGFAAAATGQSAKMERLLEIVDEAKYGGHKVIVYSYFLSVLDIVSTGVEADGALVFGPMTGAMTPAARQELIDEFSAAPAGSVLVSQVVAGGVGLNIQAASIVIMCEPQLKPSTENQAIARAHRMGQLKTVQVYRLLNPDSIDERIEEILSGKVDTFEKYARDSAFAEASGDAIDARATLRLIQGERDRIGITGAEPSLSE